MMYRKYVISDPGGSIELQVEGQEIRVVKHDIHLSIVADRDLNNLIQLTSKFMNNNSIEKVEIEEIT